MSSLGINIFTYFNNVIIKLDKNKFSSPVKVSTESLIIISTNTTVYFASNVIPKETCGQIHYRVKSILLPQAFLPNIYPHPSH